MEEKTMIMIPMHRDQTPVEPHIPGTYVMGYIDGDQESVERKLVEASQEDKNVRVENAWLVVLGITFQPMPADPNDKRQLNPQLPLNHPSQPEMRMALKHGTSVLPLTQMDHSVGLTYSVPVKGLHWVYPSGSMIQDLEMQSDAVRKQLTESRSGIAIAGAGALGNLNRPC